MRVLFVTLLSLNRSSSVTISNRALVDGFLKNNCDLTIIQPAIRMGEDFSYTDSLIDKGVNIIFLGTNIKENKESEAQNKDNQVKKKLIQTICKISDDVNPLDNSIKYIRKGKNLLKDLEQTYDLVISTSDPKSTHLFVDTLIQNGLKYKKWVQHWGDPLMNDISKKTIYSKKMMHSLEKRILKNADHIVYVSPLTMNQQKKDFKDFSNKMMFLPLISGDDKDDSIPYYDNLTIGYFGDYVTKYRNIIPLYDCVKQHSNLKLFIIGNSDISLESTENIQVLGRVSIDKLNEFQEDTLIHVCVCNTHGTQIPGKIFYHANLNRPVLVVVDGDNADDIKSLLSKFNRYEICRNDSSDIYNAIQKIITERKTDFAIPETLKSSYVVKQLIDAIGN